MSSGLGAGFLSCLPCAWGDTPLSVAKEKAWSPLFPPFLPPSLWGLGASSQWVICAARRYSRPLCLLVLSLLWLNLDLTDTAEAEQSLEHIAVLSASVSPSVKCRYSVYLP